MPETWGFFAQVFFNFIHDEEMKNLNPILILFYDPTYGLAIEDALEDSEVSYSMVKTPESLFEIDPFFL